MHSSMEFQETANLKYIRRFSGRSEKTGTALRTETNIDLICENILLKDGQGTVIDYEWSLDFSTGELSAVPEYFLFSRNMQAELPAEI